jgi:hypothetical protein
VQEKRQTKSKLEKRGNKSLNISEKYRSMQQTLKTNRAEKFRQGMHTFGQANSNIVVTRHVMKKIKNMKIASQKSCKIAFSCKTKRKNH